MIVKSLLERLDFLNNNMGSAIYEDADTCGEAAAELRRLHAENEAMSETSSQVIADNVRLHEVNQELLEALKSLVQVVAHLDPCPATLEQARAAIAKAESEKKNPGVL